MEKFIPLRDYVLGKQLKEKRKVTADLSNIDAMLKATSEQSESGIFMGLEDKEEEVTTNRLILNEIGQGVSQRDLLKEGVEVLFNNKGNQLTLNGEDFVLTSEINLFGIIERT